MPALRSRSLAPIASLAVLAFAAWQGVTTIGSTPAFNRELRVEAPYGGTRPYARGAMYDTSEYLYQMAYAHANYLANNLIRGADLTSISLEEMRASFQRASELSEQSLNYNPANAFAWMLLARSLSGVGEAEESLQALVTASELAPFSADLTMQRLVLVNTAPEEILYNKGVRDAVMRDFLMVFDENPLETAYEDADSAEIKDAIREFFEP